MLKTNSKQVKKSIRDYITSIFDISYYDLNDNENPGFNEIARAALLDVVRVVGFEVKNRYFKTWQDAFFEWASYLPGIIRTDNYLYKGSARDILGAILQETEEEKSRFTEEAAEKLLTQLIYRELTAAAGDILRI